MDSGKILPVMFNHPNANDEGYYEANISSQTLEWIHKHSGRGTISGYAGSMMRLGCWLYDNNAMDQNCLGEVMPASGISHAKPITLLACMPPGYVVEVADKGSEAGIEPRAWHGALVELAMCAVQYPGHIKPSMREVVSDVATLDALEEMALSIVQDLKRYAKSNDTAKAKRESFKIM